MDNPLRELIKTFGLVERVMQPYFARFGITGSQWGVLRVLQRAESEGLVALRLNELSERLLIQPPSVTGLVDRLQRMGLVSREASATDMRARQIRMTAAGRRLVGRILLEHQAQIDAVLAGLPAGQQAELGRLLAALGRHLQEQLKLTGDRGKSRRTARAS